MQYIKKLSRENGTSIIIITHDTRVLEEVDVVYKLEEFTFVEDKKADEEEVANKELNKKNVVLKNVQYAPHKKQSGLSFILKNINSYKKSITLAYIPLILIFCIFILVF